MSVGFGSFPCDRGTGYPVGYHNFVANDVGIVVCSWCGHSPTTSEYRQTTTTNEIPLVEDQQRTWDISDWVRSEDHYPEYDEGDSSDEY